MLSIGKLGIGQERYYLEKVAEGAEDYYSGEGEAEGQWLGDAARDLGLDGPVDAEKLTAMLTGLNPVTGEPLGLPAVGGRGAVPGFDLTYSAPKSVSLLWALGEEHVQAAVLAAHERSIEAALHYMQSQACWTRRGHGGSEFVPGNGYLAAGYRHRSSRAGDPQLHTHVLVANATKGPDGRWTRLYHPAIYRHAKTAGYLYEAQLRYELSVSLGVRWQPLRNGIAEIDGFADEHLREFSTRRAQILEAAGTDASPRSLQVATLATRGEKEETGLSTESLRERWRGRAQEIGLGEEEIARTLGAAETPRLGNPATRRRDRLQAEAARLGAEAAGNRAAEFQLSKVRRELEQMPSANCELAKALTERASHFDRRDAIQAVAASFPDGAPAADVEARADAFLASDEVVAISDHAAGQRFTTLEIWELERGALASAESMLDQTDRAIAGELAATRVLGARPTMKSDQVGMVRRLLVDGEGLVVVVGEAGTGKSYATVAAAEGWAQVGIGVQVAAPSWRAANVLRSDGLDATSVARLLGELDRQGRDALPRGSVLIVDEGGMVDSRSLARLIEHANDAKAKLVLIGDPEQLPEIEAGGLFASLAERSDVVRLDQVIRHEHDLDREGAKRIREGQGREALRLYREEDRILVAETPEGRREAMVSDWWQSYRRGDDSQLIAKRNAEIEKLNEAARKLMRSEGRLGAEEIEVGGKPFAVGDQVITRVNDHANRIYNRERWRVGEVDVEAGSLVLDGIDTRGRVCVDAVYLGRRTEKDGAPALQHGYAVTTYSAQGATVDRAYVMADPSMDRQELYVAASRSRGETRFYATPEVMVAREEIAPRSGEGRDALAHLAEAAERDGSQTAAHTEAVKGELQELPGPLLYQRREELRERFREQRRGEGVEPRTYVELGAVEDLIAQRERMAVTAARVCPPSYVVAELGQRPHDPRKAETWDRAVRGIEGYREQFGLTDSASAIGVRPTGRQQQRHWEQQHRRLERVQRELQLRRSVEQAMEIGID